MLKNLIPLFSLLIISACASTKPISAENVNNLKNSSIQTSHYTYPSFSVIKPLTAGLLGPVLGQVGHHDAGNSMVSEYNLPNPAEAIAEKVSANLEKKFGMKPVQSAKNVETTISAISYSDKADVKDLLAAYGNTKYMLDVNTSNIVIAYRLSGFYYDLSESTTIRLIESSTGNVLGQHSCAYNSKKDTDKSYTYNELTQNNAQIIKDLLNNSVNQCASESVQKIFGI